MSKTTLLTIVGCTMGAVASVGDYLLHANMEGGAFKQPTFWLSLIVAAGFGVKGYLAKGDDAPVELKKAA